MRDRVTYTEAPGNVFVDAVGVRETDRGELLSLPGEGRIWSERQNKEFFVSEFLGVPGG